ncbi:hypothetical protein [Pseudooceanicola nitratireducens]|jgi:Holliday junction resolvasome RuvABC endonuclease subunit|uniref:hypothetical protein n=1 Tax=Pseudooceanicola nitratireducens TaxID=517719 RepID=UPI003C7D4A04
MKIVALDLATSTGVAVGTPNSDPIYWSVDLGKGSEDRRFSKVLGMTHQLIVDHEPDLVAIEAAIGGNMASPFLIGLVACVRGCCANRGVRCQMYWNGAIRKHFLGKALTTRDFPGLSKVKAKAAIKNTVVKHCEMLGWSPKTHDEADALALLDYALAQNTNHQSRVSGGLL